MAKNKLKTVKKIYISVRRKLCDGAPKHYIMAPSWISMSMLLKSRTAFLIMVIIIIIINNNNNDDNNNDIENVRMGI